MANRNMERALVPVGTVKCLNLSQITNLQIPHPCTRMLFSQVSVTHKQISSWRRCLSPKYTLCCTPAVAPSTVELICLLSANGPWAPGLWFFLPSIEYKPSPFLSRCLTPTLLCKYKAAGYKELGLFQHAGLALNLSSFTNQHHDPGS